MQRTPGEVDAMDELAARTQGSCRHPLIARVVEADPPRYTSGFARPSRVVVRSPGAHARPLIDHTSRMPNDLTGPARGHTGLVDVLDRVLDKGLIVAGDIKVSLAEVELLTIRIRLMICSIDKAEEIGLDWWKYDRHLSTGRQQMLEENLELRTKLRLLEQQVATLTRGSRRRKTATSPD